jgi:hypothetical protein
MALDALHRLYPLRRCHPLCAEGAAPSLLHPAAGCAGPCAGGAPGAYAAAVEEVRSLLAGEPGAAGPLLGRLAAAAARGELHADGDLRESVAGLMAALGALARARRTLAMGAVVVEPGREPGTAVAFFISRGRVRHRAELPARGWRRAARRGLAILRAADGEPPAPLAPDGMDEAMIVADRLRERRGADGAIRLEPGWDEDAALEAIGRARRASARAAALSAAEPDPEPVPA